MIGEPSWNRASGRRLKTIHDLSSGSSTVSQTRQYLEKGSSAALSFQPNLARPKVFFDQGLKNPLRFREAISALMRREHDVVADPLYPYYQDVYDHILRVTESTDALRDLVGTIVETNISLRDFRQNQVMKQVTSWAAIIAVPTLITGFYGMNVPFPGYEQPWGFLTAFTLTASISLGLYVLFRRKEWL